MIAHVGLLLFALAAAVPQPPAVSRPAQTAETSPASSQSFQQIARSAIDAIKESRDDEAIDLLQKALNLKPDWDDGLWFLSAQLYDKHRFLEARDLIRHYMAQNPERSRGWAMLGLCDFQLREYGRALQHLQRALSLGLDGPTQWTETVTYVQAMLLTRQGQFHESMKSLVKLRLLYLAHIDNGAREQESLETLMGLCLLEYPLLPEEIPQDRREFVRKMGQAGLATESLQRDKAIKIFRELAQQYPNEQGTHYQYGTMLLQDGILLDEDRPVGVEEMRRAVALSPLNVAARLLLAQYFTRRALPEQAKSCLEEALKIQPDNSLAHKLYGELLASTGNPASAIAEFEAARKLTPDDLQLLWYLTRAYTAAGRQADAAKITAEIAAVRAKRQASK